MSQSSDTRTAGTGGRRPSGLRTVWPSGLWITGAIVGFTLCSFAAPLHLAAQRSAATASTGKPPATAASSNATSALERLQLDLMAATHLPGVERGIWGIAVQSIDRQERLFELNPRTLLVPASTAKLLTAATAVDSVGWAYRFDTTLQTNGTIVDGTLKGDLLIVGSGDPSTGGRGGEDLSAWIAALKAMGVQQIDGRVIGDDDALEEPRPQFGWAWDDLGTSGALYGALNLEENRMTVTVLPGPAPGAPVEITVDPVAAFRPIKVRAVTGERGSAPLIWSEQRPGELALTVAGSIPTGAVPARMTLAVGNPTLWFAQALRFRLIEAGIPVNGDAVDVDDLDAAPDRRALTILYTSRSRPLSDLVKPLFKDSINLYGEALFRLNAPRATPTNDAAIEQIRRKMIAWGVPDGQQLVDGSGLSRRDVIAADTLLLVLQRMYDPDTTAPWMAALPIAGVDGTLQSRFRATPAERNLRAKTGSMSNVRSLAGYVTTRDGEHLAFAILLNNFEGTGALALQAIDSIAVTLAAFTRKM